MSELVKGGCPSCGAPYVGGICGYCMQTAIDNEQIEKVVVVKPEVRSSEVKLPATREDLQSKKHNLLIPLTIGLIGAAIGGAGLELATSSMARELPMWIYEFARPNTVTNIGLAITLLGAIETAAGLAMITKTVNQITNNI